LWSPPYFSRLWCVFELAAYRKVNPEGKITFAPLFIERTILLAVLCLYLSNFSVLLASTGDGTNVLQHFGYAVMCVPFALTVRSLRKNYRTKHQLLHDMEHFDLNSVGCSNQFDGEFIHEAIAKWYGNKDAFTRFIRGPLRQELRETVSSTHVPVYGILLFLTATLSSSLDFLLALVKAGAPWTSLLAFAATDVLGISIFWVPASLVIMVDLSDRFAPQWQGIADHLQTLGIVVLVLACIELGRLLAKLSSSSLPSAGAFLAGAACVAFSSILLQRRMACFAERARTWGTADDGAVGAVGPATPSPGSSFHQSSIHTASLRTASSRRASTQESELGPVYGREEASEYSAGTDSVPATNFL